MKHPTPISLWRSRRSSGSICLEDHRGTLVADVTEESCSSRRNRAGWLTRGSFALWALALCAICVCPAGWAATAYTAGPVNKVLCFSNDLPAAKGGLVSVTNCYVAERHCSFACTIYCYSEGVSIATSWSCGGGTCENPPMCLQMRRLSAQQQCGSAIPDPCVSNRGGKDVVCPESNIVREACQRDRFQSPCADTDRTEVCCESIN